MIVIGYDYDGKVVSIVNARSEELARAYWHGADIIPHSIKTLEDFTKLEEHPTGVYPLLKTREVDGYEINQNNRDKKYLIITK